MCVSERVSEREYGCVSERVRRESMSVCVVWGCVCVCVRESMCVCVCVW